MEFKYDLARLTQDHGPKINDALKTARAGDTIHILAPLGNGSVHHTWYDVVDRGERGLKARRVDDGIK